MIKTNYKSWESFHLAGEKFLSLTKKNGREVEVYGRDLEFYGSYHSTENFMAMYRKKGKELSLGF